MRPLPAAFRPLATCPSVGQSQFNAGFDGDSDDGIFDEFDFVILGGDFDNNGLVDDFEF